MIWRVASRRVEAHKAGTGSTFTRPIWRELASSSVYYEPFAYVDQAIRREKTLKHWVRQWKINSRENPHWSDVYTLIAGAARKLDP